MKYFNHNNTFRLSEVNENFAMLNRLIHFLGHTYLNSISLNVLISVENDF